MSPVSAATCRNRTHPRRHHLHHHLHHRRRHLHRHPPLLLRQRAFVMTSSIQRASSRKISRGFASGASGERTWSNQNKLIEASSPFFLVVTCMCRNLAFANTKTSSGHAHGFKSGWCVLFETAGAAARRAASSLGLTLLPTVRFRKTPPLSHFYLQKL